MKLDTLLMSFLGDFFSRYVKDTIIHNISQLWKYIETSLLFYIDFDFFHNSILALIPNSFSPTALS